MGTREVWRESATQCLRLLSFEINSLGINNFKALLIWIREPSFSMYHFDFLLLDVSQLRPSSSSHSTMSVVEKFISWSSYISSSCVKCFTKSLSSLSSSRFSMATSFATLFRKFTSSTNFNLL